MIWQFILSSGESPKEKKKNHSLLGTIFKVEKIGEKSPEKKMTYNSL